MSSFDFGTALDCSNPPVGTAPVPSAEWTAPDGEAGPAAPGPAVNLELGIRDIVLQHVNALEQEAIARLIAAGYRVTKPKTKRTEIRERPKLNAVGKPYGPQFDPSYRMKHKPPKYAPSSGGRIICESEYLSLMRKTRGESWEPSWRQS